MANISLVFSCFRSQRTKEVQTINF